MKNAQRAIYVACGAVGLLLPQWASATDVYHLSFDDEFNSLQLSTYNSSGYRPNNSAADSGWLTRDQGDNTYYPANDEAEYYANPAINPYNPFSISSGVLAITAKSTSAAGMTGNTSQPYVSGELTSAQGGQAYNNSNGFSQEYGYFEMRCQLPAGQGLWPAFWLLPEPNRSSATGEYDIFEVLGNQTKTIYQTAHYTGSPGSYAYASPFDTSTGFHTYGFEWDANNIRWYVDGNLTQTLTNGVNAPMYILANLAVGGNGSWPGAANPSVFPATMDIDYIRVYSDSGSVPAVTPQPGYSIDPSTLPITVPEPASLSLLAGTSCLFLRRRRTRKAS